MTMRLFIVAVCFMPVLLCQDEKAKKPWGNGKPPRDSMEVMKNGRELKLAFQYDHGVFAVTNQDLVSISFLEFEATPDSGSDGKLLARRSNIRPGDTAKVSITDFYGQSGDISLDFLHVREVGIIATGLLPDGTWGWCLEIVKLKK